MSRLWQATVAMGLVALPAGCSGGGIATPAATPEPATTATPGATVTPGPTGEYTATPFPTVTPRPPPTPTVAPTSARTPTPTLELSEVYENGSLWYQLRYPAGWTVSESGPVTTITHPVRTNVVVTGQRTANLTLEQHVAQSLRTFADEVGNAGVKDFREVSRVTLSNPPRVQVTAKATSANVPITETLVFAVNQGVGLLVVGTVRDTLADVHQPVLDQVLASLQLLAPAAPPADDYGNSTAQAQAVETGGKITGAIERAGDQDVFKFQGTAGTTYQVSATPGTLADPALLLHGPGADCLLTVNDDSGGGLGSLIRWRATADGMYYVTVVSAVGDGDGSYTLALATTMDAATDDYGNAACSAAPVSLDTAVMGNLEEKADSDWFSFRGEAGMTYTVTVSLGTLQDSLLLLWVTGDTSAAASNDDYDNTLASQLVFTVATTGVYYLQVQNADGRSAGTYTLTMTARVADRTAPVLATATPRP